MQRNKLEGNSKRENKEYCSWEYVNCDSEIKCRGTSYNPCLFTKLNSQCQI